jgi:actin-related protein 5
MKSIANLAADDRVPKKKRKGGGGNTHPHYMLFYLTVVSEDLFGADDADWAIYRKIVGMIGLYFQGHVLSYTSRTPLMFHPMRKMILISFKQWSRSYLATILPSPASTRMLLLHLNVLLLFRPSGHCTRKEILKVYMSVHHTMQLIRIFVGSMRIHLNTERWRVCETWFSPGMAGVDTAGLGEVIQNILARFSESAKSRLVKVRVSCLPRLDAFTYDAHRTCS